MRISRSFMYAGFVALVLTTEFYYISIGGGTARIYHFLAPFVILALVDRCHRLFDSPIVLAIVGFLFVNVIALALSDDPMKAAASSLTLCANISVAIATALILLSRRLSIRQFTRLVTAMTVVTILFGLVQILAYLAGGLVLALSEAQIDQIRIGFGPSFFKEANGFGKHMVFPILFLLPFYLRSPSKSRPTWLLVLMLVGLLMNFTRSGLYGIIIALLFASIWYASTRQFFLLARRMSTPLAVVILGVGLLMSGAVPFSEYGLLKMQKFFDQTEILEGESSALRLEGMNAAIEITLADPKKVLIGNGWGQAYAYVGGEERQVGGADIVNIFAYGGVFGVLLYIVYCVTIGITLARHARRATDPTLKSFMEGVLFAYVGLFIMSLMSGALLAPGYWTAIGAAIYVSLLPLRQTSQVGSARIGQPTLEHRP
jgi:hypothetical protein